MVSIRNTLSTLLILSIALTGINAVDAAEAALNCPAEISEGSVQIRTPSPEWHGFAGLPFRLHGAVFMSGDPSSREHLKGSSRETKEKEISTWKFEGDYPNGKWLSCLYAMGFISLSQRIDDRFSECSLVYRKDAKDKNGQWVPGGIEKISCK